MISPLKMPASNTWESFLKNSDNWVFRWNFKGDDIHIPSQEIYEIQSFLDGSVLTIYDHPWPGFTPDLLSIVLVAPHRQEVSVLIHQKMFESRLFFVDKLIDMGAQIILCDPHRAAVIGLGKRAQSCEVLR